MKKEWEMMPFLPVSWGEVFDKLTILQIKLLKFNDESKKSNVSREKEKIDEVIGDMDKYPKRLNELVKKLFEINLRLWDVEDSKRQYEVTQKFTDEFITLSREVYLKNDKRAAIKKEINLLLNSYIVEEKSHKL